MYDIFLSYSNQDREQLRPLYQALSQAGWTVFWDHTSIRTGENWHRKIETAIKNSRCVVVAWSAQSVQSEWVLEEAQYARQQNCLLPIRVDHTPPPFGFGMRQTSDFTQWNQRADHPCFVELAQLLAGFAQPSRLAFEPEMVRIPAGSFVMGYVEGRDDVDGGCHVDEKPARTVQVAAFEMGKYPITFAEYDACTAAGVCPKADDKGWGRGNRISANLSP